MNDTLKRTPLYDEHVGLGARIVPFAGYEMPVQYSGVVAEHLAVRQTAGLFDVSHMGEFLVEGPDALKNLERLTPNDVASLAVGQAQYSALLTERGTFVDDVLVYRRGADRFLIVVNASNEAKDFAWIEDHLEGEVHAQNRSDAYALIALQGPRAEAILAPLADRPVGELASFRFREDVHVAGVPALVSRTGYTGEDGFELYLAPADAPRLWRALIEAGAPEDLLPAGLGARDTLRLEARLPLYGNDIDDSRTPLEAGVAFIVKLAKGDFLGRDVLERQKAEGVATKLVGLEMSGREIARHGYPVFVDGAEVGSVTSGSHAPFLKTNVGLAYLPADRSAIGTAIEIGIRERRAGARLVKTPFYRRAQP